MFDNTTLNPGFEHRTISLFSFKPVAQINHQSDTVYPASFDATLQ